MKHIDLKMFTVQEWLKTGRLRVHKAWTHDNRADLMTKAMTRETLINLGRAVNLRGPFFAATCTVTSVTPSTETLTVLDEHSQQLSKSQTLSFLVKLGKQPLRQ